MMQVALDAIGVEEWRPSETMIRFFVYSAPQQKGSKTGVYNKQTGRTWVRENNTKAKGLQEDVRRVATETKIIEEWEMLPAGAPVYIRATFWVPRPKNIPKVRLGLPTTAPDLDKYQRTLGDALSGVIYHDDCMITDWQACKRYAVQPYGPGLSIEIRPMERTCQIKSTPPTTIPMDL